MGQVMQIVGALMVLAAFALAQAGKLATNSRAYLALNLVGAGILAVDAAVHRQFGFLLLEASWAAVAAFGLLRPRPGEPRRSPGA